MNEELNVDRLRAAVLAALSSTDGISDPELRSIAFEKVLESLLRGERSQDASGTVAGESSHRQKPVAKRATRPDNEALERIRPLLEADPSAIGELTAIASGLPSKFQIYCALDFANQKTGLERMTIPELREAMRRVFRIGIPDGTLSGVLSKAPPTEVGRVRVEGHETEYQLMSAGKDALKLAVERARSSATENSNTKLS